MEIKNRNPALALILSLAASGVGQIYNGQPKKGVLFYLCPFGLSLIILLSVTFFANKFINIILFVLVLAFFIYVLADALFIALRIHAYYLESYNKWYLYLLLIIIQSLMMGPVTHTFLLETYRLPTGSMEPTLLGGDYLIADKLIYHIRDPVRGDLAVFKHPKDEKKVYLKRIVGLPGEGIEIRDNLAYINGVLLKEDYVSKNEACLSLESLCNHGPVIVLAGKFFVLGDNRNESVDSRIFGFVDKDKIEGKVRAIYWSWERKSFRVRWSRIGKIVQ
jgi:signal peptidase I